MSILNNNHNTYYPRFSFTSKKEAFPKTGVSFYLWWCLNLQYVASSHLPALTCKRLEQCDLSTRKSYWHQPNIRTNRWQLVFTHESATTVITDYSHSLLCLSALPVMSGYVSRGKTRLPRTHPKPTLSVSQAGHASWFDDANNFNDMGCSRDDYKISSLVRKAVWALLEPSSG